MHFHCLKKNDPQLFYQMMYDAARDALGSANKSKSRFRKAAALRAMNHFRNRLRAFS